MTLRFIALLLAALTMGMRLAHALEPEPKLQRKAGLFLAVQTTRHRWSFGIGPVPIVGALLAFRLRGHRGFALTLVLAVAIVLAPVAWAVPWTATPMMAQ